MEPQRGQLYVGLGELFGAAWRPFRGTDDPPANWVGLREHLPDSPRFHGKTVENRWFPVTMFPSTNPLIHGLTKGDLW